MSSKILTQAKQASTNEKLSQSTDDSLNKLSEEEIRLIRVDYDIKQVIENIEINTTDDVDLAINYIKQWFLKDEIRYTNELITLLE